MYRKRLKNVYDLLEAGNNRKVIQEVDKLISSSTSSGNKKKPAANEIAYDEEATFIIAKSLKCLALVRIGRKSDSDILIEELLTSNTTDENALSIIMQYCKETQQLPKIALFYENAVKKCQEDPKMLNTPEYEEIVSSLFYSYIRNRDYAKQQQLAVKLYKQTNKIMYCYWNAASYVLMSNECANEQQKAMYLQLAEKILQKTYDDKKMEYNGEFLLYLDILESRKKYTEALKLIESINDKEQLSLIGQVNFKHKRVLLYNKYLGEWQKVKEICEKYFLELSESNLDDWLTYLDYFNAIIEIIKKEKQPSLIESVFEFLNELKSKLVEKVQGPYLAPIELMNFLMQADLLNEEEKKKYQVKLKECFSEYVTIFSSKPGIFYEIKKYDKLIESFHLSEGILEVLKSLHDKNRPFASVKSIYICLAYWQVHRYFGYQSKMEHKELEDLAIQFESFYLEALNFGKDLLPTAFQYGDEFLIMSTHIRYSLNQNVLTLISNLKQALHHSPTNFQIKLLLLNLFTHLGAYDSLKKVYESMEIKNIQNYSTANMLIFHNIRLGSIESSLSTSYLITNFFTSGLFEMSSFMANCFKYGTFPKACEINSFINEIKKSLSLTICLTNNISIQVILDQVLNSNSDEQDFTNDFKYLKERIDKFFKDTENFTIQTDLIDHHDKDVIYNWNFYQEKSKLDLTYSQMIQDQTKLLKLRNLLIRFLGSCLSAWIYEDSQSIPKLQEFKLELDKFDFNSSQGLDSYIFLAKSEYFKRFSQLKLNTLLIKFFNLACDLAQGESFLEKEHLSLNTYKIEINEILQSIKDSIENLNESNVGEILESFSALGELLSYVILILTSSLSSKSLKPIWTEKCKKSKKKKAEFLRFAQSIDLIFEIYESIANLLGFSLASLNRVQEVVNSDKKWEKIKPTFGVNESSEGVDLAEISNSYKQSFEELKKIFNSKLKYLTKFSNSTLAKLPAVENLKI